MFYMVLYMGLYLHTYLYHSNITKRYGYFFLNVWIFSIFGLQIIFMEDVSLKALLTIEKSLIAELQAQPVFLRLEAIQVAIKTFQKGNGAIENTSTASTLNGSKTYDSNLPWTGKVKNVIHILGEASTADIIKEIQKYEPHHEKKFLDKRVGVTLSQLKNRGMINSRQVNKKRKYFIK